MCEHCKNIEEIIANPHDYSYLSDDNELCDKLEDQLNYALMVDLYESYTEDPYLNDQ